MEVGELGFVEDDGFLTMKMMDEIDWEDMFQLDDDVVPEKEKEKGVEFYDSQVILGEEEQAPVTVDPWIGEIEQLLMNDDDIHEGKLELEGWDWDNQQGKGLNLSNEFQVSVSDILLDSPNDQEQPDVVDASSPSEDKKNSPTTSTPSLSEGEGEGNVIVNVNPTSKNNNINTPTDDIEKMDAAAFGATDSKEDDSDHDDDPVSKKRKRQLRNRDAAMRSRERKKMYVKDLEMKSRYLEAECRRLGRLLQCCYAENQMLRISLQSGSTFGASMAKPESAVLLLESLLLGSLVWFMALMCLSPLSRLPLLSRDAVALGSVKREDLESAVPREKGTEAIELWLSFSFLRSKRCRASWTKMKSDFVCTIHLV